MGPHGGAHIERKRRASEAQDFIRSEEENESNVVDLGWGLGLGTPAGHRGTQHRSRKLFYFFA